MCSVYCADKGLQSKCPFFALILILTSWLVDRGIWKKNILNFLICTLFYPRDSPGYLLKMFSPFGPAVWPAIGNIHIYECLLLIYTFNLQPSTSIWWLKNIKLIKNVMIKFKIDGVGSILTLQSKWERGALIGRYERRSGFSIC